MHAYWMSQEENWNSEGSYKTGGKKVARNERKQGMKREEKKNLGENMCLQNQNIWLDL